MPSLAVSDFYPEPVSFIKTNPACYFITINNHSIFMNREDHCPQNSFSQEALPDADASQSFSRLDLVKCRSYVRKRQSKLSLLPTISRFRNQSCLNSSPRNFPLKGQGHTLNNFYFSKTS